MLGDVDSDLQEFTMDSGRAPQGIGRGQPDGVLAKNSYVNHRTEAIFLAGLPDVPESRPHSKVNNRRFRRWVVQRNFVQNNRGRWTVWNPSGSARARP